MGHNLPPLQQWSPGAVLVHGAKFQQSVLLFGVSVPSASCSSWPTFHESEDKCTNQHTEVYLHSASPIIKTCTYDQHAAAAHLRSESPRASVQFSPPECAYVRFTPSLCWLSAPLLALSASAAGRQVPKCWGAVYEFDVQHTYNSTGPGEPYG